MERITWGAYLIDVGKIKVAGGSKAGWKKCRDNIEILGGV